MMLRYAALAAAILAACTSQTRVATHSGVTISSVDLGPNHGWYNTYSVFDIGKPGVPKLTPRQRAWLELVHGASAYKSRWQTLHFALPSEPPYPHHATPLIVFDAYDWKPGTTPLGMRFQVIGSPCTVWYGIEQDDYVATTEASCSQTPPPVPGEKRLLGTGP
jgi:hypothetical protein